MLLIYLTLLAQSLEIDQNGGPVDILIDNKRVFTVESEYLGSLSSSLDEVLKNVREGDNHIKIAQDGSEISYTVNIPNTGNSGGGENVNQSILDILNETLRDYVKRDEINMSDYYTKGDIQRNLQALSNVFKYMLETYYYNTSAIDDILENYSLKTEVPDVSPLATKTELSNYVTKTDINFEKNERLFKEILSTGYISDVPVMLLSSNYGLGFANQNTLQHLGFSWDSDMVFKMFKAEPWESWEQILQIHFMDDVFNLVSTRTIQVNGSKIVTEFDLANQSKTVTHLCPISEEHNIDDFIIGAPVYLTGKVFKKVNNDWFPTTKEDSIDCISSVKTNGTWREYLGICTSKTDKEIRFASHGDFLVTVDDSSTFKVGDIIHLTDSGGIGVIDDDTALTVKVSRSIIGVVTRVVDGRTVAVFKD